MTINRTIDEPQARMKAVDFFCGGGGMSYGMQLAGVEVLAGIDCEAACEKTYVSNINNAEFINCDVFELCERQLAQDLGLQENDDDLILIGCSPCQYWSIINTDKNKSEKSKNLLVEFSRFVKHLRPGYVVVENVPGVLRRKKESGLEKFIGWLERNGYVVHFKIHNTQDYGVPQSRKRFTLVANRVTNKEVEPRKSEQIRTVVDAIGEQNGFSRVNAGHKDKTDFMHTVANVEYITLGLSKNPVSGSSAKGVLKDGVNALFRNFNTVLGTSFSSPLTIS